MKLPIDPRWSRLAIASTVIGLVWLLVLPRLERVPQVRDRIELLDRERIDPAAMFYTELECMGDLEQSVTASVSGQPAAFWSGARSSGSQSSRP